MSEWRNLLSPETAQQVARALKVGRTLTAAQEFFEFCWAQDILNFVDLFDKGIPFPSATPPSHLEMAYRAKQAGTIDRAFESRWMRALLELDELAQKGLA